MEQTVVFRADWSTVIGLGHLQRCLALMDALKDYGFCGIFVARAADGMSASVVQSRANTALVMSAGASTNLLSEAEDAAHFLKVLGDRSPQVVIVDHYKLGYIWEASINEALNVPVVAIDGSADRAHAAAMVIDPTFASGAERWKGLLAPESELLRGVEFTLVAPQFADALLQRPERDGRIRRILISFGGSDPFNSTVVAIEAIAASSLAGIPADVVVGATHPNPNRIRQLCDASPTLAFHHDTSNMAELSANADLAIGAGGISVFERAFVGLPALVVIASENQRMQVESIAPTGAIVNLGEASGLSVERLAMRLNLLHSDAQKVKSMSLASRLLMRHSLDPGSTLVAKRILSLCQ